MGNKVNLRKAISVNRNDTLDIASKAAAEPDKKRGGGSGAIAPPYELNKLLDMVQTSSILPQCIDAMIAGCERGYTLMKADGIKSEDNAEWDIIKSFLESCDPEGKHSFDEIRKRTRRDKETLGYAAWEICRNTSGQMIGIRHIPANTLKMTPVDTGVVDVKIKRVFKGNLEVQSIKRRFRKFIQEVAGEKVYFKEYGDSRTMDYTNGDFNESTTNKASEILFWPGYSPGTPYGRPRWIGAFIENAGIRAASELNYGYFDSNGIPAALLFVNGGILSDDSFDELKSFVTNNVTGRGKQHSLVVLEAEPFSTTNTQNEKAAPVKLEFKPLRDAQISDAQFLNYIKDSKDTVRSTFRLPPLLVGMSADYNRATAEESVRQAEEQVFKPEREAFDFIINRLLIQELEMTKWKFETLGIDLSNPEDIERMIRVGSDSAAITPNEIRQVVQKQIGLDLDELPSEIGNIPFLLQSLGLSSNEENLSKSEKLLKSLWELKEGLEKSDGNAESHSNTH